MRYLTLTLIWLSTTAHAADEQRLIYVEPMGGVYTQDWFISDVTYYAAGIRTMTVSGDGKAGDFQGQLYVDCPNAELSKWLSVEDLYLKSSSVPFEAIVGIRDVVCDGT